MKRLLGAWVALLLSAHPAMGQEEPAFAGLLNEWGLAEPAAVFSEGAWHRLASDSDFKQRYRSLDRDHRHRWFLPGADTTAVLGGPLVHFDDTYFGSWALVTDVAGTEVIPNHRPKTIGPIVSSPHRLNAIEDVLGTASVVAAVEARLVDQVGPLHDSGLEFEQVFLVRPTQRADSWIYFRAVQPSGGDPRCPYVEVISGWLQGSPATGRLHSAPRGRLDCDRKGDEFLVPLGVLEINERLFVLADVNEWESNYLAVVELGDDGPTRPISPH